MTEPLTPEEARRQADAFKGAAEFARWCIRKEKGDAASMAEKAEWNDRLAATVSAYADQAERLSAYEEAVGEVENAVELALKYWRDRQQRYRNRSPVWVGAANNALARLRALQEK